MLQTLDKKVKTFPLVLTRKGGMVNTVVAVATAETLIVRMMMILDVYYCGTTFS